MNGRNRFALSFFCSVLVTGACSGKAPTSRGSGGVPGSAGSTGAGGASAGAAGGSAGAAPSGSAGGSGAGGGGAGGGGGAAGAAGAQAGAGAAGVDGGASGAGGAADAAAGTGGGSQAGATGAGGVIGTGCKGATICYDFEQCATPPGWTVPKFAGGEGNMGAGTLLVDNEKAHGGTCSLHMKDYSGDNAQHAFIANLPANFGPLLWGRAWVFNTFAPAQHGSLVKTRYSIPNSTDLDWYEVGYEYKNYNGHWHNPLPPSGLPEWIVRSTTPVAVGRWQCVEWLFDAGNPGGAEAADPRIWIDGQEVMYLPGVEYDLSNQTGLPRPKTPKGNNFVSIEVGLTMYHPLEATLNVYLDDLAFGKERIGCDP